MIREGSHVYICIVSVPFHCVYFNFSCEKAGLNISVNLCPHVHPVVTMQIKWMRFCIMLTCPCNVDPLISHFHMVKLGFTGVYIIFLFLL